jgi:hypothetical protein
LPALSRRLVLTTVCKWYGVVKSSSRIGGLTRFVRFRERPRQLGEATEAICLDRSARDISMHHR